MTKFGQRQQSFLASESKASLQAEPPHGLSLRLELARKHNLRIKKKGKFQCGWRFFTPSAILASSRFDNMISMFIMVNAISIGVEANSSAQNLTDNSPTTYRVVELFFCAIFTSELILRIWVHRLRFLFRMEL